MWNKFNNKSIISFTIADYLLKLLGFLLLPPPPRRYLRPLGPYSNPHVLLLPLDSEEPVYNHHALILMEIQTSQ